MHKRIINEIHFEGKEVIRQIPVVYENHEDLRKLITFLKGKGYSGNAGTEARKALYLLIEEKEYFEPSITTMACWCSGKRYPLGVDEFIEHYDRIVVDHDHDFYSRIVTAKCMEDPKRKANKVAIIRPLELSTNCEKTSVYYLNISFKKTNC